MPSSKDISRYRDNLQGEIDSANLYRSLAQIEQQPQLAEIYKRMAEVEERHCSYWEEQIRQAGAPVVPRRPSWRSRLLCSLARRFGIQFVLPTVTAAEDNGRNSYAAQPEARKVNMAAEERSHGRLLNMITSTTSTGMAGSSLVKLEGRHKNIGGNALRASVLGANDGLCSNLSLVMAVVGATASANMDSKAILITGLAGLIAGACSMAMGEWLSVQSSRELYQHEMATEAEELANSPEEEMQELALIYQAKGIAPEDAQRMAETLISDPTHALDTLAREELGIDPGELGGSAWEAAGMSFLLFVTGAIIPVAPFILSQLKLMSGQSAAISSLILSTGALYLIGGAISLITGRSAIYSGLRQVVFGLGAAGITFAIGHLIGVSIS